MMEVGTDCAFPLLAAKCRRTPTPKKPSPAMDIAMMVGDVTTPRFTAWKRRICGSSQCADLHRQGQGSGQVASARQGCWWWANRPPHMPNRDEVGAVLPTGNFTG